MAVFALHDLWSSIKAGLGKQNRIKNMFVVYQFVWLVSLSYESTNVCGQFQKIA